MSSMPKSRLKRREVGGFVAVADKSCQPGTYNGWLYLRRQSDDILFIGNLPWPTWLPVASTISDDDQKRLQMHVSKLVPGAESVADVFSTGNIRLGMRAKMRDAKALDKVLAHPENHIYFTACSKMRAVADNDKSSDANATLARWLQEYDAERDEDAVTAWSNAAMRAYETRERLAAEAKARREKLASVPDADGFVTVTKGAPQMKLADVKAQNSSDPSTTRKSLKSSKRKRNALSSVTKGIEKTGIYRWERPNVSTLAELRDKFRGDQKRVAAIRGLKPLPGTDFHGPNSGDPH